MANKKIKDIDEKATGVATDEFVINDVAAGNKDKKLGMDGIRITESQITDLQSYLLNIAEDTTPQLGGALDGQGNDLNNMGVLFLTEQAEAEADVAGKGQLWVDTATPNVLKFTDDAGTDATFQRSTTVIVASNTSLAQNKVMADRIANATDDDVTIDAAYADLPAVGGIVKLMEGEYNTNAGVIDPVTLSSLVGVGMFTTTIKPVNSASAAELIRADQSNTEFENFGMDGNAAAEPSGTGDLIKGVLSATMDNVSFRKLRFKDSKETALHITGQTSNKTNFKIIDNLFEEIDKTAIHVEETNRAVIALNIIDQYAVDATAIARGIELKEVTNSVVIGNVVAGAGGGSISAQVAYHLGGGKNIAIVGNVAVGSLQDSFNGNAFNEALAGIVADDAGDSGIAFAGGTGTPDSNVAVAGFAINSATEIGVLIGGGNVTGVPQDYVISGGVIKATKNQEGIRLIGASGVKIKQTIFNAIISEGALDTDATSNGHGFTATQSENFILSNIISSNNADKGFTFSNTTNDFIFCNSISVGNTEGDLTEDSGAVTKQIFGNLPYTMNTHFHMDGTAAVVSLADSGSDLQIGGFETLDEISTPANPAANKIRLYGLDVDGQSQLAFKNSGGTEVTFQRAATIVVAANDASAESKAMADSVCDGTADDVQIQAAIDGLGTEGGKILLTEGIFSFTNRLLIDSGDGPLTLQGQGSRVSIIKPVAGFTDDGIIFLQNLDDVELLDFKIDCSDQTGGTTPGINAQAGVQDMLIQNVFITNTRGNAINLTESTLADRRVRIRDCEINLSGQGAIRVTKCRQVTISGCHIVKYAQVTASNSGIRILNSEDCVVTGNYVEGGNLDVAGEFTIIVNGTGGSRSKNVTVSNNVTFNSNSDHIVSNDSDHVSIVGNSCSGGKDVGIAVTNAATHTAIIGNTLDGIDQACILVGNDADDTTVIGNSCNGSVNTAGIQLGGGSGTECDRIIVSGNICTDNATYGITISQFSRTVTCCNNITSGNGTADINNDGVTEVFLYGNTIPATNTNFVLADDGLKLNNPADTFSYNFRTSAILVDRDVTIPLLTGNDTFSLIGFAETRSAVMTFSADPVFQDNVKVSLGTGSDSTLVDTGSLVIFDFDEQNVGSRSFDFQSDTTSLLKIDDSVITAGVVIDTPDIETATVSARDGSLAITIADSTGVSTFVSGAVLVAPVLGTPASGTMTNVTGTSGITGLGAQTQALDMSAEDVDDMGSTSFNEESLTISAGVVTSTKSRFTVDTEASASTDDLDTITDDVAGTIYFCQSGSSSRDPTFTEAGNMVLAGSFTCTNSRDTITLMQISSTLIGEVSRSDNQ